MQSYSDHKVGGIPPASADGLDLTMEDAPFRASRAYQLEMLQMSLKENVIVAMDTGSGKTQIAILRIRAQLESSSDQKLIWFLAPTVLLCAQQVAAIRMEIPSISIRLIVGNDNVHTWGASTWKSLLSGTQAVVSTYQVLLDALDHAFVKLDAHNCVGSHPGGKIMNHFYHYQTRPHEAANSSARPAILGLTATPSMQAHITGVEKLEKVLDAKCVSPSLHREELLRHVKRPQLRIIECESTSTEHYTESMTSLRQECVKMDILEDPYVISLRTQNTDRSMRRLQRVMAEQKTWSRLQVSSLLNRSRTIRNVLGRWAADFYIWRSKHTFLQNLESVVPSLDGWIPEEKLYIARVLQDIAALEPTPRPIGQDSVSDKVHLLLRELLTFQGDVIGIIFVTERATAAVLAALLRSIPGIRDRYQIGCMVGTSNNQLRKRSLYEFFGSNDLQTLHEFREGTINLLVATAVLEEGIDVPACNLVICFDSPQSPKSFIQRRGRARMQDSTLLLFTHKESSIIDEWAVFEEEIQKLCQDSEREHQHLQTLERLDEGIDFCFRVPYTGARLDHDNAKQHLEHFCRVISSRQYTDGRPDYVTKLTEGDHGLAITAQVFLPASLPPKLRVFQSSRSWLSEANAMKDAAFQAYLALFHAGLVNKNLLPLEINIDLEVESRAAIIGVQPLLEPWAEVAAAWSEGDFRWAYTVQVRGPDDVFFGDYTMTLPVELGPLRPANLYLDYNTTCRLEFSPPRRIPTSEANEMKDHTSTLIGLHFCHRWPMTEGPHVIKLTSHDDSLNLAGIGNRPFDADSAAVSSRDYLIRDRSQAPSRYLSDLPVKPPMNMVQRPFRDYEVAPEEPYLNLLRWTRRTDFLHPIKVDPETQILSQKQYASVLPVSYATMDSIHIKHARFGMLVPSIVHIIETMLIVRQLSVTLLGPLGISDYFLLRDAISARSAMEPTHYERLEFLGDSILKYCASMQAAVTNLDWSEGYLSKYKERLIANSRLSRAAVETGLSRFILSMPFTGQKWRPFHLETVLAGTMKPSPKRNLSTKVLADVVEALIGVAYTVGGIPKTIQCLSIFITECDWMDPSDCREEFFSCAPSHSVNSSYLHVLEELVGYSFTKKSLLLEATTHASYIGDIFGRSWERLEFIGDSILDYIIVNKLINHTPPLAHSQMHIIKTAMVNMDFLAFISLEEHELSQTESFVTESGTVLTENKHTALWKFIRHSSSGIGPAQLETAKRHVQFRGAILRAIRDGDHYPWHILIKLHASKFYSDLVEAVVGALWVDSGSLAPCEAFLARVGILPYLDRVLADGVHMQHPKEELGKLAQARTVVYNIDEVPDDEGGKTYSCRLVVGGVEVGSGRGGLTAEEVRVGAATEAVAYLKAEAAFQADDEVADA
ncbi:RNA helicase RNAse [Cordyceps militaris]|uniref:RNA helicase RNAse n=1 Tax=Cordyceps militaris TaxID=73501 RepID=A0A2H4SLL8_CORMI|nr:RNA helicase RNAse [Cordyceps militaris]